MKSVGRYFKVKDVSRTFVGSVDVVRRWNEIQSEKWLPQQLFSPTGEKVKAKVNTPPASICL